MVLRFLTGSLAVAVLALTTGLATQAQAGNIVLDPGFESAAVTLFSSAGYTGSLGDGAWTVTAGTIYISNTADGEGAVPHSGSQFAYLDGFETSNQLSQTLTTVAGQSYLVSFWIADETTDPDQLEVEFGSQVLYNGAAPNSGVSSASDYQNYTYDVTATSSSTNLLFIGQYGGGFSFGTILDDVSVTNATTPEPATLGFTGLGCLVLLAVRGRALRRKRA